MSYMYFSKIVIEVLKIGVSFYFRMKMFQLHLGVIAKSKKSNSGLHLDVMTNLEEVMTVAGLMTTGEMTDVTTAVMTADLIAGMTEDLIAVMTALMNVEEEAAGVVHLAAMIVDLTVGMTAG